MTENNKPSNLIQALAKFLIVAGLLDLVYVLIRPLDLKNLLIPVCFFLVAIFVEVSSIREIMQNDK